MEVKDIFGALVGIIVGLLCILGLVICHIPRKMHQTFRDRKQKKQDAEREAAAPPAARNTAAQDLEMGRGPNEVVRNSLQGNRLVAVVESGAAASQQAGGQNGNNSHSSDDDRIAPAVSGLSIAGLVGVPAGSTVVGGNGPLTEQSVQSCGRDWGVPPTPTGSVQARLLTPYRGYGSVQSTPVQDGNTRGGPQPDAPGHEQPGDEQPGHEYRDEQANTQQEQLVEETEHAVSEVQNLKNVRITEDEEAGELNED